jgi:hypothetical protein
MSTSTLLGPHRLDFDEIEAHVPRVTPGVFVTGHLNYQDKFLMKAIGRSDCDLRTGLRELIGSGGHFLYCVTPTSKAAFEEECRLFHELRPNTPIHPVRSENKNWTCPYCQVSRGHLPSAR